VRKWQDAPSWTIPALWRAIAVLLFISAMAFVVKGADEPSDPSLRSSGAAVAGFSEIGFRVAPGSSAHCALLAADEAARQRGLMGRSDLAGHDAMLFRFDADAAVAFYMRDTPLPLSIAWFDAAGNFISSTDMAPCPDRADCPVYFAARPYRFALEVARGSLKRLAVGPGAHLSAGGPCS